jgi:hypothetical protein
MRRSTRHHSSLSDRTGHGVVALINCVVGLFIGGLVTTATVMASIVVTATPAGAHTGAGPTNEEVRLLAVEPSVDGLDLTVRAGGMAVLDNRTGDEVVVLGGQDEPFLRLIDGKVWENRLAPTTYTTRSLQGDQPPDFADASAAPEWVPRDGGVARWHDHRLHNMGSAASGTFDWQIDLLVAGSPVAATGELEVLDAPAAWPWWLVGVGVFAAGVLAGRLVGTRRHLAVVLATASVAGVVVAVGAGWLLLGVVASLVALAAVAVTIRPGPAGLWSAIAAAALGLMAATELSDLGYANLAVTVPDALYRLSVVAAVGLSAAAAVVALASVGRVRTAPPDTRSTSAEAPLVS